MAWEYKVVQGPKERHLNRIITEEELSKFDKQGAGAGDRIFNKGGNCR
jgi:hypothetical protein